MESVTRGSIGFVIAGRVTFWDARSRLLELDGQELWVPRTVPLRRVVIGALVVVGGHQDRTGKRVVSRLHFG